MNETGIGFAMAVGALALISFGEFLASRSQPQWVKPAYSRDPDLLSAKKKGVSIAGAIQTYSEKNGGKWPLKGNTSDLGSYTLNTNDLADFHYLRPKQALAAKTPTITEIGYVQGKSHRLYVCANGSFEWQPSDPTNVPRPRAR